LVIPWFIGWFSFGLLRFLFNKCNLDNADSYGREFEPRENFFASDSRIGSNHAVNQNSDRTIELENYA